MTPLFFSFGITHHSSYGQFKRCVHDPLLRECGHRARNLMDHSMGFLISRCSEKAHLRYDLLPFLLRSSHHILFLALKLWKERKEDGALMMRDFMKTVACDFCLTSSFHNSFLLILFLSCDTHHCDIWSSLFFSLSSRCPDPPPAITTPDNSDPEQNSFNEIQSGQGPRVDRSFDPDSPHQTTFSSRGFITYTQAPESGSRTSFATTSQLLSSFHLLSYSLMFLFGLPSLLLSSQL